MLEKIYNKLKIVNENVKNSNYFLENYPQFLDDLEYMLSQLSIDIKQLSALEKYDNSSEIKEYGINYYRNLVRLYMNFFYHLDIKIQYDDLPINAEYVWNEDCMHVGWVLKILNIEGLQAICHEVGHKRLKDFSKIESFNDLIKYPPYMIFLLKERLSEEILTCDDEDFYDNNYNLLYYEQEANVYSFEFLNNLLSVTYEKYQSFAKENNITVSEKFLNQLKRLQKLISDGLIDIEKKYIKRCQLSHNLINEFSQDNPINSSIILNGERVDRLILYDKCIKDNPNLQEQYPILKLLFKGDKPKNYNEILLDMGKYLQYYPESKDKIVKIYNSVIKSDPILYISILVANNNASLLENFLDNHKNIFIAYRDEINQIIAESNNDLIISLLQRKIR